MITNVCDDGGSEKGKNNDSDGDDFLSLMTTIFLSILIIIINFKGVSGFIFQRLPT